jgi:benzoyl-CoA reductase/2-hydroxyglutaryl-CoA dehydratase subunit BcrC/BadD/HgdB
MSESLKILQFNYQNRQFTALEKHNAGEQVIGYTSNTVPVELIEAAGFYPTLVDAHCTDFTGSDQYMEPVFDQRTKSIFHEIITGKWAFLQALIIPRTSEAEHKLFLYLMEVKRLTNNPNIPEIYFFDLLHSQNALSEEYSFEQVKLLDTYLKNLWHADDTDVPSQINTVFLKNQNKSAFLKETAFHLAIELSNKIKNQLNQLSEFRYQGLLSGVEAMTIIGAMYFMDRKDYLHQLKIAISEISTRNPLKIKQKILVKGYCINHSDFHKSLEKDGKIVVAEDDWWGNRAGGSMIEISENPLKSIFDKYYFHSPSPRVFPMTKAHEWLKNEMKKDIDLVEFYITKDDDVLGWELFNFKN